MDEKQWKGPERCDIVKAKGAINQEELKLSDTGPQKRRGDTMGKNRIGSLFLGGCLLAVNMMFAGGTLEKAFAEEITVIEEAEALEGVSSAEAPESKEAVLEETSKESVLQRYAQILRQYDKVWSNKTGMEQYSEESLVNYLVYMGYWGEASQLVFSLTDLDGNGTEELVIGLLHSGDFEKVSSLDLYTVAEGSPVRLLDSGERWSFQICENGILGENSSGGAAHNYQSYWKIGADGRSCDAVEYYYVNGEDQTVENLEGNLQPFDGNYEQYLKRYPEANLDWKILGQGEIENLLEDSVPLEDMTAEDIVEAPHFRKGRCSNMTEVAANYYLRKLGYENYKNYWFNQDYLEKDQEKDYFSIQDAATGETFSEVEIDCRTGNAKETRSDGTVLEYSVFDITKTEK